MDHAVTVEFTTTTPLTADQLDDLAELGGVATGNPGERKASATMTQGNTDVVSAAMQAVDRVRHLVSIDQVDALEVLTTDEQDRRNSGPAFPELVGIAEIAGMLDVTRQRASQLQTLHSFPSPVARLKSGPVWRKGDLSTFVSTWERKSGRPAKPAPASAPGDRSSRTGRVGRVAASPPKAVKRATTPAKLVSTSKTKKHRRADTSL